MTDQQIVEGSYLSRFRDEYEDVEARTLTGAGTPPDLEETRLAVRCNVCRRWLVDPESVVLGVGPTCRGERG